MVVYERVHSTNKVIYARMCFSRIADSRNQKHRQGRPSSANISHGLYTQENTGPPTRGLFPANIVSLDLKTLKEKDSTEVVHKLNEGMTRLKFLLRSQEEQHNSDEFIYDLTCTLAKACRAPSGENTNNILAALKGSVFLNKKIPSLLDRVQASITLNDQVSRKRLIQCLIDVFVKYLTHLPSSYVDLPYVQLKLALDQSNINNKEELETKLDAFKQARDDIIRSERQKNGNRFINKVREKPPNDFRDIPISPTTKEITTQERPFLRKNISKGRYDNVEHYLDVQFRLLREDFLDPLREGIHEIALNIPRHKRKQSMKTYRSVRIVSKELTWSGITYQVQIDVSELNTSTWVHSKRLLFGSFLCLSKDNFKTMLFATISKRDPDKLKEGKICIRFIEEQDVSGIENRNYVYQMVESPAYFEAYRHVLKGLKELDETTLPFKKYLVECSKKVDPPEYLRQGDTDKPIYYDLSFALDVPDVSNATAVPVLQPGAWSWLKGLSMNSSQLEALRTAITTEFSVIQGPPGTGKTYVGAKIVRCLLENRRAWDPDGISPMLMVCYTNHALDQFLEKVLEFLPSKEIIRVGGRSKNQNLEKCNVKQFTHRHKMYEKRHEVEDKMRQTDRDMKKCKALFSKADHQLLEFDDVEEMVNPAHAQQLYNAIFPCNVANKSQSPGNTFKLWLCNNKLVGSCNQTPDGLILEERGAKGDDVLFYDASLFTTPESFIAVNVSNEANKTRLQSKLVVSEQNDTKETSYECTLPRRLLAEQSSSFKWAQSSSNASRASLELNCTPLEIVGSTEVAHNIQGTERPQTQNQLSSQKPEKLSEADEETIAIEMEADLIKHQRWIQGDEELLLTISEQPAELLNEEQQQGWPNEENDNGWTLLANTKKGRSFSWMRTDGENSKIKHQRWIQGDEDLLLPISEQTGELLNEEQHQGWPNEENDNGWTLLNNTKKDRSFPWMRTDGENSKKNSKSFKGLGVESEDETAKTKSPKKAKNTNKSSKINITGDISSLEQKLKITEMMSTKEAMAVENIWNLSQSDRLRLYLFWIENYRERYRVEIFRGEQEYEQLCEELEAIRFQEEEQVIRQATVVGMTTSGAARYHSMLQRIAPKIVVIEEAAEVMEAHIITSLSHNTKHTILIGDHKQLRPKATVYELAQKYNLEVSLFERMVMNSMDCKRLSIQHRMRPEIAALTKRIYDHEIIDHESVCDFQDISGVCRNLFFIDHRQPESLIEGLHSFSNHHEAEFVVALCKYLLLQGYSGNQITILTMYIGQLLLLQKKMPRREFQGVKICAVDNFQGEENDIILLSLVRSNLEGSIGFLAESNRICVALSRARKGLYCIGNFSLLKSKSKLWKEICDDLKTKEAIGDSLQLVCKRHNNVTSIRWPSDFSNSQLGGCAMSCGDRLDCGHACDKPCHVSDEYHVNGLCSKMCLNSCPNNHKCSKPCHYPEGCDKCRELVLKTLPRCGHKQSVKCSIDLEDVSCPLQCKRVLECGHPCSKKCKEPCQCNTDIEVQLPCEHSIRVWCREKDFPIQCKERCKRALDCGHDCSGYCHEECKTKECKITLLKDLPCGHQKSVACFLDPQTVVCFAPCRRQLDCGHKCLFVCCRPGREVQCEELCQKKCERDHPCQKRCHFPASCDDCNVEVNKTIPTCQHSIKMPCYTDLATLKCKRPCERIRACGHPCKEICGEICEAQLCEVLVSRTLSCKHVVILACHSNLEKIICKKVVDVNLSCGHKKSLKCYVEKDGLEHVLCKEKVEKKLRCNHKLTLPCFKNPEDCICKEEVSVELPCGHMKSVVCSTATTGLPNVCCMVKVTRILPCDHKAILPCHTNPEEYCCQEEVEITLSCGHNKRTTCSDKRNELEGGICDINVTRKLPCGHKKEMQCSDEIVCDASCERFLPCGHPCPNKCGDDCTSFKCAFAVDKDLTCGYHKVSCLCSEDVSQFMCSNRCTRKLTCGHQCPAKCSEECSLHKCQEMVDPDSVACQERCNQSLECGHPCPGLCSEPCASMKCMHGVEKKYPCGHMENLQCFENNTATCKAPCRRQKRCKHMCMGVCGEPCSKYPCNVVLGKTLPCGHKVKMPCNFSVDDAQCPAPCGAKLPCGHRCFGTCGECKQWGSHKRCQNRCNRILFCSHRCQSTCSKPCPPCIRQCGQRCPHGKCTKDCSQPCCLCQKPCTWLCPHYQCQNLCGEECDRPRCDAPCPKKLPCRHPCIGLCGENCPTMCAICHSKRLVSMVGNKRKTTTETTRYLQLFDCGHILEVEEMDAWMFRERGNDVQLIQCPRCSIPITFSYRYGNIIKRTLRNIENVKTQIRELGNEKASYFSNLLKTLRYPPLGILAVLKSLSRYSYSMALDNVPAHCISLVFALTNNLLILHQVEKAHHILEIVTKHEENSKEQLQVTENSRTIKGALKNISEYLEKPRFDLTTLNHVHEHTKKFTLFASILEAQCEGIKCQSSFSATCKKRLKKAQTELNLFMQGNNGALHIGWLEKLAASLREEVGLTPILPEEPINFENIPGFNRGVWKLCEHRQVYFTRSIVRNGEHVSMRRSGCIQCVHMEDSGRNSAEEA